MAADSAPPWLAITTAVAPLMSPVDLPDDFGHEPQHLRHVAQRGDDRRAPAQSQQRRRQLRFEEDFERTAGQARVHHHRSAGRVREMDLTVGQHPQEHALVGLQRPEAALRTEFCAHCPPTIPSIVPSDNRIARSPSHGGGGRLQPPPPSRARRVRSRSSSAARAVKLIAPSIRHALNRHRPLSDRRGRAPLHGLPHPRRRERHVGVPDPERRQGSTTAFTTAGGDPTVADSPMPLAPIGWCGDGVT